METTRDQTRALLYAIGVHLIAGFILFAGLLFSSREKPVIAGGAIDAVFVDLSVGAPTPATAPAPKPQPPVPKPAPEPPKPEPEPPKPEPKPEEPAPPPPPPQAKPDDVTDQRPVLPSVDQEALNLEKEQEKLRVEQEKARVQAEKEAQRIQQLEDIRSRRIKAAAEAAVEERKLADAKAAQQEAQRVAQILNQAAPAAPEGSQRRGADVADSLSSQYYGLIRDLVTQSWRRPLNTPMGIRCVVNVRQIPGGEVIGVTIGSPCNAPESVRQSILDAFERASPLPYSGFEEVFDPSLPFQFEYDG